MAKTQLLLLLFMFVIAGCQIKYYKLGAHAELQFYPDSTYYAYSYVAPRGYGPGLQYGDVYIGKWHMEVDTLIMTVQSWKRINDSTLIEVGRSEVGQYYKKGNKLVDCRHLYDPYMSIFNIPSQDYKKGKNRYLRKLESGDSVVWIGYTSEEEDRRMIYGFYNLDDPKESPQ